MNELGQIAKFNAWIFIFLIPVFILCLPLLFLFVPIMLVVSYLLFRKPKEKPQTLDEWWADNYRDYL